MMNKKELIHYLETQDRPQVEALFKQAYKKKVDTIGEKVFLRGLIEISNKCKKDCLYCGIRCSNTNVTRYELSDQQVLEAASFASRMSYGSLVIQGGELASAAFADRITRLLEAIKKMDSNLGITLSLGEQSPEVYKQWFEAGAHRYLLRIETTNRDLYYKIHPHDKVHSFSERIKALHSLRETGYQLGTGVMIGLPFQTSEDLANDLLFFKELDIDMCGMGPYLEHSQTPLYASKDSLLSPDVRLDLSIRMVALLRLLCPDINIAATTAMQTINPNGREWAILAGANIVMPNMTIQEVRDSYQIYENKPSIADDAAISKSKIEENLTKFGIPIGWNEWGDSQHFKSRK